MDIVIASIRRSSTTSSSRLVDSCEPPVKAVWYWVCRIVLEWTRMRLCMSRYLFQSDSLPRYKSVILVIFLITSQHLPFPSLQKIKSTQLIVLNLDLRSSHENE